MPVLSLPCMELDCELRQVKKLAWPVLELGVLPDGRVNVEPALVSRRLES